MVTSSLCANSAQKVRGSVSCGCCSTSPQTRWLPATEVHPSRDQPPRRPRGHAPCKGAQGEPHLSPALEGARRSSAVAASHPPLTWQLLGLSVCPCVLLCLWPLGLAPTGQPSGVSSADPSLDDSCRDPLLPVRPWLKVLGGHIFGGHHSAYYIMFLKIFHGRNTAHPAALPRVTWFSLQGSLHVSPVCLFVWGQTNTLLPAATGTPRGQAGLRLLCALLHPQPQSRASHAAGAQNTHSLDE